MANLNGRFYLKKTSNANLIGEFSNNQSAEIYTESAFAKDGTTSYIGNYYSTWQENKIAHFAELNISFKYEGNNKIFKLVWMEDKTTIFNGEGMLCDNILIGDYNLR